MCLNRFRASRKVTFVLQNDSNHLFWIEGTRRGGTNHLMQCMIEREREKRKKATQKKEEGKQEEKKMHKYKQIRPERLCVGMSARVGENHREEERGLNCITALQTVLLGLERGLS